MSTSLTPDEARRVVDLLGDADQDVRLRAALQLGQSRHAASAAPLVARFGRERDFTVRETLTWAVLRIREHALPLVRDELRSPRWLARLQATHTISKVGDPADGERLLAVIDDPVDCVAARAYWAAAECGDPVVLPALLGQLSRGSSEHRNGLLVALSRFGAAAVPGLAHGVRHGATAGVRRHAADILGYIGSPDADPAQGALVAAVDDPDADVRLAALNALGQLAVPDAWRVIDTHMSSSEHRLQLLATRLTERRPSQRVLRAAGRARDLPDDRDLAADIQVRGPIGRDWPTPDLDLVTCEGGPFAAQLAPLLALQVEVCRPQYLSRADVPAEVVAGVHAEALDRARRSGRTEDMARRIADGAVEQLFHDQVLLEQVSVTDPGVVVKDLLFGTEVQVTWFQRLDPPAAPDGPG